MSEEKFVLFVFIGGVKGLLLLGMIRVLGTEIPVVGTLITTGCFEEYREEEGKETNEEELDGCVDLE